MKTQKLQYYLIRVVTFPFGFMPYRMIHAIGRFLGLVAYHTMPIYRKRALSNLALAKDLNLSEKEIIRYAKESFQNLAINCLEYPRFYREKDFSRVIQCVNPEIADELYQKNKGIIFFCGHQSNWEVLFLDGTRRMSGIAIGRPIKNKLLYNWILKIREKNAGKMIIPRNALREGLKALRKGSVFLGIVGDQGMPDSNYAFPFLGRRAWNSTAPGLLAYKTNCPIIVATTRRLKGKYQITYSKPIWPNLNQPVESEVKRLMNDSLTALQESILKSPGEWLWQHNRWKQQTPRILYKRFRHDCVCVILPDQEKEFKKLLPHLHTLQKIYAKSHLVFIVPKKFRNTMSIQPDELFTYSNPKETLINDFRFKFVFNFTLYAPIKIYYERRSAFEVIDMQELELLASPHMTPTTPRTPSEIFKRSLCRPNTLWSQESS